MTRLEIMQALSPRFDYDAYVAACSANNFEPQQRGTWAQLMGMMSAAEALYPELPIDEAYPKFMSRVNAEQEEHNRKQIELAKQNGTVSSDVTTHCGSCGGGKVR